jgi:DNA-binding beta-propeller fold protein YncE
MVVFDADQMSVEIHELGLFPIGLAVVSEPDDSYTAYASIRGENLVRIFDLATMQVVDESIRVGASPGGIAVHPDGHKIYVINSDENSISVLGY